MYYKGNAFYEQKIIELQILEYCLCQITSFNYNNKQLTLLLFFVFNAANNKNKPNLDS